ncbi:hypothetical protein HPB48_010586 [Haemaphysalis longicornis]|uniref:EGF-like domain-containing protein n=1 Tax=Haemaphysalis longicornis TaxID=44386 RepID=A0A9J6H4N2_HAELO|nr:hypothetical protein HPB48_010586 [Haemaphysalis longicornis]
MAPYHLLAAAAVLAATAFRGVELTSILRDCETFGECRDTGYRECRSRRWYCAWSGGNWDYDGMTDCQYGVHGCVQDWCGTAPISGTCEPIPTSCRAGYTFDATSQRCEDINECTRSYGRVCCPNSVCINKPGSYECQCKSGFEKGPNGRTCIDINECVLNTHDCQGNQTCVNRNGGFDCKCPSGYRLNSLKECVGVSPLCLVVIGECRRLIASLKLFSTPGLSRHCIIVSTTFSQCLVRSVKAANLIRLFADIDECTSYPRRVCRGQSECVNTPGSYFCECKEGFKMGYDAHTCIDINECVRSFGRVCCFNSECINTPGSYECQCRPGFEKGANGQTCIDIDECTSSPGRVCRGQSECVNTPGSYFCQCKEGFRRGFDAHTCIDINECEQGDVCPGEDEVCVNTMGAYRCSMVHCPHGFTRDSYRKTRCRRVNVNRVDTVACREHPLSVTYSHVALSHNLKLPSSGQQSFFHLRGPRSGYSSIDFDLELVDATTSSSDSDVELATRDHFLLERTSSNEAIVSLVKPLQGPQDVELELRTTVSHHGRCSGTTVSKIFIFVSGKNF